MAGSLWFYVQRILIPYQASDALAHGRPRGILSDLYPRWLGTRELLLQHRDPYSDEVTQEIQRGYYGRVLDQNRPGDPKDQQRFAYPVYVVFLLAPLTPVDFATARLIAEVALALVTAIAVFLWLHTLRWRPPLGIIAILFVLSVNSWPAVQGIKLEQLSLLVAALIAAAAALMVSDQLFLAGVLLALATIKPQLAVLPAAWLMLWTVSRWRERQSFFWGFTGGVALLIAAGEYLSPGWIPKFIAGLAAYERYTGGHSLLDELASRTGGAVLAVVAILGALAVAWRTRRLPADSAAFGHVFAFMLAITLLVVPMTAPYNQVLLLPAVFLIVRSWNRLWNASGLSCLVCVLAALVVLWPWIASLGLAVASLVLRPAAVQRAWALPLWTSIAVPLVVLPLLFPLLNDGLRDSTRVSSTTPV